MIIGRIGGASALVFVSLLGCSVDEAPESNPQDNARLTLLDAQRVVTYFLSTAEWTDSQATLGDHEVRLTAAEADIGALTTDYQAVAADLVALEVGQQATANDVGVLASTLGGLEGLVNLLEGEVASLNVTVSELTSGIREIDATNAPFISTRARSGSRVSVVGTVTVPFAGWRGLETEQGLVMGGTIQGGGLEIELGNNSKIQGVIFEDVVLDGSGNITFEDCYFRGNVQLPFGSVVRNSNFIGAIVSPITAIESIENSEIDDSNIQRVERVESSFVDGSILGEGSGSALDWFHNNRVSDSSVLPGTDATVVGNKFEDSFLWFTSSNMRGMINVSNNGFDGVNFQPEAVLVETSTSSYLVMTISDNVFYGGSGIAKMVTISGTATGTYQSIGIHGNTFQRSTAAASSTSNIRLAISNNHLNGMAMGITAGGSVTINNNIP